MKRYKREPVKQTPPTLERIQAKEAEGYSMKRERAKLARATTGSRKSPPS